MLTRSKSFERTDLLAALTDQTVRTAGWTVRPPNYAHVTYTDFARLQAPANPTGEYQMALRLRRTSSSTSQPGMFVVGLPHARSQFLLVLDQPLPGQGFASYLTLSNVKRPEDNPTFQLQAGLTQRLTTGREWSLTCSVAPNQIRVLLDGQPLIDYQGDMNRLTMPKEWSVPDGRSLFLGARPGKLFDLRLGDCSAARRPGERAAAGNCGPHVSAADRQSQLQCPAAVFAEAEGEAEAELARAISTAWRPSGPPH